MLMNLSLFMHCRDAEDESIPGLHWLGGGQVAGAPDADALTPTGG